jgi:ribosomal protein S12 methylthiotransferase accessory factor
MDIVPAAPLSESDGFAGRAVSAFLRFLEHRLGVDIVHNARTLPADPALIAPMRLGSLLYARGVIKEYGKNTESFPDEPRMKGWYAVCADESSHRVGGMSLESDVDALYATLAEALERYVWFTRTDYFLDAASATTEGILRRGRAISPERFVGFDSIMRSSDVTRILRPESEYVWLRGNSLVRGDNVFLPAQTVSPKRADVARRTEGEPAIRPATTNGLATSTTREGAQVAGILELVERDAYMATWLNQLSLPRYSTYALAQLDASLARALDSCARYHLKVHVLRMPTDAPTHAIAVVLEDTSSVAPKYAIGLRAHQSLTYATKKALTEALRARRGYRSWAKDNRWDAATPVSRVGHRDRLYYWGMPEYAERLDFLVAGQEALPVGAEWEADTDREHRLRLVTWCAKRGYECISVPLTTSRANPTDLHIEMMVIPELQPMYLSESTRTFGGTRWQEVARACGYTARNEPFADAPHPFT